MIIYKITNTVNGKVYIGQTTTTLLKRKNGHNADSKRDRKRKPKSKISAAICKYGMDNFKFEFMSSASCQDELNSLEVEYIAMFKSNVDEFGYNLLSGGKQNGRHSEETKRKISITLKENPNKYWLGKAHSDESNRKRSETTKGKSCPQRGRKFTDEQKKEISDRIKACRANNFWSTIKAKETVTSA